MKAKKHLHTTSENGHHITSENRHHTDTGQLGPFIVVACEFLENILRGVFCVRFEWGGGV